MTDKKTARLNVWHLIMCISPVAILSTNNSATAGFSAGHALMSGLAAACGSLCYYLCADKHWSIKLVATCCLIIAAVFAANMYQKTLSDEAILTQKWPAQQLGSVAFKSPEKLLQEPVEVPEELEFFYEELIIYAKDEPRRATFYMQFTLHTDTISMLDFFPNTLEGMLQKIDVDLESLSYEDYEASTKVIETKFSYRHFGKRLTGFGFMTQKENVVESLWLIPYKSGFSEDYIRYFRESINAIRI